MVSHGHYESASLLWAVDQLDSVKLAFPGASGASLSSHPCLFHIVSSAVAWLLCVEACPYFSCMPYCCPPINQLSAFSMTLLKALAY